MKKLIRLSLGMSFAILLILPFTVTSFGQKSEKPDGKTIIEFDSIQISVTGNKSSFIPFIFKRSMRVRINSEEGIEAFSRIEIPDSFDPILKIHSPEARNTGKHLTNIEINKFTAKITKREGGIINPELVPEIQLFRAVDISDDRYGEYFSFIF